MLELGPSGSVRGVLGNEHPYREPRSIPAVSRVDPGRLEEMECSSARSKLGWLTSHSRFSRV
jgi:hypothetical protein